MKIENNRKLADKVLQVVRQKLKTMEVEDCCYLGSYQNGDDFDLDELYAEYFPELQEA